MLNLFLRCKTCGKKIGAVSLAVEPANVVVTDIGSVCISCLPSKIKAMKEAGKFPDVVENSTRFINS
jgi:hypothetical protein